jgi:pyrophosphate--fructose-6-phosphate 1-phosphotransferase
LIEKYAARFTEEDGLKIVCYLHGFRGLLTGESVTVSPKKTATKKLLNEGGSPLGNSRVKLSNVEDCVKRKLVKEGEVPSEVAAQQLVADGITILHVIGGDDSSLQAGDLAAYLANHGYPLTVMCLPKTVDNDIYPVKQSLGAITAAEQGAAFFHRIVNESTAEDRMLLINVCMGRDSGWLTARTAKIYCDSYRGGGEGGGEGGRGGGGNSSDDGDGGGGDDNDDDDDLELGFCSVSDRRDIHAIYVPEIDINLSTEIERLRRVMDKNRCVNIFVSEGAFVSHLIAELERGGQVLPRDAFGHVKLSVVDAGKFFSDRFGPALGASKVLVEKSGYYSRSAPAGAADLALIDNFCEVAVDAAIHGLSGLVGEDDSSSSAAAASAASAASASPSVIAFSRLKGSRPFATTAPWFTAMQAAILKAYP